MLLTVLLLAAVFGFAMFLMGQAVRWTGERFRRDVVTRVRAAETIIEQRHLPDDWLAPYRAKIEALRSAGKSEEDVARVGHNAQAQCLRKIDELMRFFRQVNVTDTPDTRRTILAALQTRRDQWSATPWQELFAPPPPPEEDTQQRLRTYDAAHARVPSNLAHSGEEQHR